MLAIIIFSLCCIALGFVLSCAFYELYMLWKDENEAGLSHWAKRWKR